MTGAWSPTAPVTTAHGRPAFVVNVDVLLHRRDRWLLIRRGAGEAHAPGALGAVGGKVDAGAGGKDILERSARREVLEEVGVDLAGVALTYVESGAFQTDDGDPVINVVFCAPLPAGAEPVVASPQEVAGLVWLTLAEAAADPGVHRGPGGLCGGPRTCGDGEAGAPADPPGWAVSCGGHDAGRGGFE